MRVLLAFGAMFGLVVVAAVVFVIMSPKGTPLDCSTVSVPVAAQFTALDDEQRQDRMGNVLGCDKLDGADRTQVQAAFGPPTKRYDNALEYAFDVNGTYAGGQPYEPDTTAILFDAAGRVTDFETKDLRDPSAR